MQLAIANHHIKKKLHMMWSNPMISVFYHEQHSKLGLTCQAISAVAICFRFYLGDVATDHACSLPFYPFL